jgi:hypothetical protein
MKKSKECFGEKRRAHCAHYIFVRSFRDEISKQNERFFVPQNSRTIRLILVRFYIGALLTKFSKATCARDAV